LEESLSTEVVGSCGRLWRPSRAQDELASGRSNDLDKSRSRLFTPSRKSTRAKDLLGTDREKVARDLSNSTTASPTRGIYVFSPCLSALVLVFNPEDICASFRAVYLVHASRWLTSAKSRAIRGRTEQRLIHTSKD
jgi:hypothetical protein